MISRILSFSASSVPTQPVYITRKIDCLYTSVSRFVLSSSWTTLMIMSAPCKAAAVFAFSLHFWTLFLLDSRFATAVSLIFLFSPSDNSSSTSSKLDPSESNSAWFLGYSASKEGYSLTSRVLAAASTTLGALRDLVYLAMQGATTSLSQFNLLLIFKSDYSRKQSRSSKSLPLACDPTLLNSSTWHSH